MAEDTPDVPVVCSFCGKIIEPTQKAIMNGDLVFHDPDCLRYSKLTFREAWKQAEKSQQDIKDLSGLHKK
jgi:hypothetical protein